MMVEVKTYGQILVVFGTGMLMGMKEKCFFFFLQTIQNDDVSIHIDGEAI